MLAIPRLHPPMMVNPDYRRQVHQAQGQFADLIAEMDYRVGQILDAVKEAGIDDNTIVILSSDDAGGGAIPQPGQVQMGPGAVIFSTRRSREACGCLQ